MRHRIVRTLAALVAAGAVAGGSAAYAGTVHHHGRRADSPHHIHLANGVTGMTGSTGSHHCPGM
jgi:hypothetical protein